MAERQVAGFAVHRRNGLLSRAARASFWGVNIMMPIWYVWMFTHWSHLPPHASRLMVFGIAYWFVVGAISGLMAYRLKKK